ncbi:MAG: hypothetical protein ACJ8G3_04995 [Burkholderiaceae bacterium]
MLDPLLVLLSVPFAPPLGFPLPSGVLNTIPASEAELLLNEDWDDVCSAELLPRDSPNGPSEVKEGGCVALPAGEGSDEVSKANGANEVSGFVPGCGEALLLAV